MKSIKNMKKILITMIALFVLLLLVGCDFLSISTDSSQNPSTTDSTNSNGSTTDSSTTDSNTTDSSTNDNTNSDIGENDNIFKVSLKYNGQPFTSISSIPITVNWNDGITYVDAEVDKNGVATAVGLDGDYNVSVKNLPSGYTYNPNIYVATNDTPEITVEILKLGTLSGSGINEYKRMTLNQTSMYRAELKKDGQKIFFEFRAPKSGTYTIESWVSVADDKINPKIDVYTSNFAAPIYRYTLDGGGEEGRYTKNFKYEVNISKEMLSENGQVVFIFAIYTTARNDKYYPSTVDFAVQYEGGFQLEHIQSDFMVPNELYGIMADKIRSLKAMTLEEFLGEYSLVGLEEHYTEIYNQIQGVSEGTLNDGLSLNVFLNSYEEIRSIAEGYLKSYFNHYYSDIVGKEWHNPATVIDGKQVLISTDYRYNENTLFYHKYSEELYGDDPYGYGAGYGPILYADINEPMRTLVLDTAFTMIEYRGNKNLTLESGRENYKFFIESYQSAQNMSQQVLGGGIECDDAFIDLVGYKSLVNVHGAVPVTRELMEFLQKYSVSQLLFMDGDGWAESDEAHPYESTEHDQWLFACGYYE